MNTKRLALLPFLCLAACEPTTVDVEDPTDTPDEAEEALPGDDLPLGEVDEGGLKGDGTYRNALTCKPVPELPRLTAPQIFISVEGLTLRLVDPATGFEKVFPIGPGAIDRKAGSVTQGESFSMDPVLRYGRNNFEITPATIQPCKTWWTDAATGRRSPVFAGLPFLSWSGNYGIHGPIDNFDAPNGGNLRRGFVSHGCLRMEAADILEVYSRIRGVARIPVHVQREPERDADGVRIDVESKWIGAECETDDQCGFEGGFCKPNRYSGRGFCTVRCERTCADRAGEPTTFCVADPDDAAQGICVARTAAQNPDCRAYDHFVPKNQNRFRQAARADVCVPGSRGWTGEHCFADAECVGGNRCTGATADRPGTCTMPCTRFCTDMDGFATTRCVDEPTLGGGTCLRQCTPATNAPECPADNTCRARPRKGVANASADVCVPVF